MVGPVPRCRLLRSFVRVPGSGTNDKMVPPRVLDLSNVSSTAASVGTTMPREYYQQWQQQQRQQRLKRQQQRIQRDDEEEVSSSSGDSKRFCPPTQTVVGNVRA